MSVLVLQRVPGDTAQFESFMASNAELVERLSERAKAEGCIAHRFAVGEGEIVIADVWESAEAFQGFITSPELQQVIGEMGARGEPEITIAAAKGFPGEF